MDIQVRFQADLIVQSFVHVARQLAGTPAAAATPEHYAQIQSAAEKHSCALNLLLRDVIRMADKALRDELLTPAERSQLCATAALTITDAQKAIVRVAMQYAAHRLAA